ncbi:hypothetical protein FANTH_10179 [Fusarium anthophilum]|uniref:Uncharacterized protein n=1 Tax=Fusarium anthophilum TaxID=48485 RepID=A0A8H5DXE0_9HYPO|nr:hypothetical protein FANTH_10179 [Fusarium anthophilum]
MGASGTFNTYYPAIANTLKSSDIKIQTYALRGNMASYARPASKLIELLSDKSQSPNLTIVDTILLHLGIADIYSLHASSRSLRWLVDYMTESPCLLNITRQLQPFVRDPLRFRQELGKHDGLIAGDSVRNFFEFNRWEVSSLLLYIKQGPKYQGFIKYLLDHEGYKAYSEPTIFRRSNTPDIYIVIIATPDSPIVEIINKAVTTAGLNFVSWNKAYCLLPIPTVVFHKLYPLKPIDNALGKSLRQRAKWGWTTRDMLWPDLTTRLVSRKECRQIGGPSSLIIKLGNAPPGDYNPDYVLEGSVYSVVWKSLPDTCRRLSVTMKPAPVSYALRYAHANGEVGYGCKNWERFLCDRLDRWIYVEIAKMDRDQQPQGFYHMAPAKYRVRIPAGYQVPEMWDYADDQIIPWFQEWEESWTMSNDYYGG